MSGRVLLAFIQKTEIKMKKRLLSALLLSLLCTSVFADELADGVKAWEKQDFAQAHKVFSRLAQAGNAEAQLLLGEMYGYGEGVPEDMPQAQRWLKQAQAGGNKDAAASLATMAERATHKDDIAYYVNYTGAELSLEKAGCVKPALPELSKTRVEIKAVDASVRQWRACYEGFAAKLNSLLPAGKAIPVDTAKLMSLVELQRARSAMDQAYAAIAADAGKQAEQLQSANTAWFVNSEKYANAQVRIIHEESIQRNRNTPDVMLQAQMRGQKK